MKAYLLRQPDLGFDSVEAIVANTTKGIIGVRSDSLTQDLASYNYAIRWGCTATIPHTHQTDQKVVNKASAIHEVYDKPNFRKKLHAAGLAMPVFVSASIEEDWAYPLVVRPKTHQEGANFHIVTNNVEYREAIKACGRGWYAAPYIQKVKEYRVNCLQGRVLCVIEKSAANSNDLTWSEGSVTIHLWSDWPLNVCKAAVSALKLSGLHFAGVDIIVGPDGVVHVLELNSAPWLEGSYQGQVFAKGFDYILSHDNADPFSEPTGSTWKHFIHPALSQSAIVS